MVGRPRRDGAGHRSADGGQELVVGAGAGIERRGLGVITASDLLRFHADKKNPLKVCAWQLCTYKPITVRPDATVSEVAGLMVEKSIHHVVVTEGADIQGVVSSLDFVRTFISLP